ncbi:MAG: GreA/GreB family elongation factor [Planctomycetota bacterium]
MISYQAPLAKALLARSAGDSVSVSLPSGETRVDILAVERVIGEPVKREA